MVILICVLKITDQFIYTGQFEVNVLTLTEPPKEYMARRVNNEWVQIIKDKILQQPHLISTILPVLVDPCQVKFILNKF